MKTRTPAPTHYGVLGVAPDATPAEVTQAYRERVSAQHPDRFPAGSTEWREANENLKAANAAYAVLKDPATRAAYDRAVLGNGTASDSATSPPPGPVSSASGSASGNTATMGRQSASPYRNGVPDAHRRKRREQRRRIKARQEAGIRAGVWTALGIALFLGGLFACYQAETLWYRRQAFDISISGGGDRRRAARLLGVVTARRPSDADAHYRLGLMLDGIGESRAAVAEYEAALTRSTTGNIAVRRSLADAYARAGQTSAAITTYRQYLQLARAIPAERHYVAAAENRLRDLELWQNSGGNDEGVPTFPAAERGPL